jgi:hypothetical protein
VGRRVTVGDPINRDFRVLLQLADPGQ